MILVYWKLFSKAGYSGWLSLLMLVPLVNFGMMLFLAFADWPVLRELRALRPGTATAQPAIRAVIPPPAQPQAYGARKATRPQGYHRRRRQRRHRATPRRASASSRGTRVAARARPSADTSGSGAAGADRRATRPALSAGAVARRVTNWRREPLTWVAIAGTLVLWASAFAGIKAGMRLTPAGIPGPDGYGPGQVALLRFGTASLVLAGYAVATRMRLPARKDCAHAARRVPRHHGLPSRAELR